MAVHTSFSDVVRTGWIDRGLGLLMAIILLMAGVAVCVYGMITFNSQAENAAAGPPVVTTMAPDFGQADE